MIKANVGKQRHSVVLPPWQETGNDQQQLKSFDSEDEHSGRRAARLQGRIDKCWSHVLKPFYSDRTTKWSTVIITAHDYIITTFKQIPRDHKNKNTVSAGDWAWSSYGQKLLGHTVQVSQSMDWRSNVGLTLRLSSTTCENTGFTLINSVYYRRASYCDTDVMSYMIMLTRWRASSLADLEQSISIFCGMIT